MKPTLLVLGTFHMRFMPDLFLPEFDHKLSSSRIQEMKDLVQQFKKFKPTKIALEVETNKIESVNDEYQSYINGQFDLKIDETHQVGYRLAADCGHKSVYPVDWMESVGQKSIGEVLEWAEAHQPDLYSSVMDANKGFLENLKDRSILDIFKECNDENLIHATKEKFMTIARIGEVDNYVGIDWMRWWYQRNLIIFSNLTRLIASNDERILLLIGGSHIHLIQKFAKESGLFHIEPAIKYLASEKVFT
jgi:hypothetical protein